MSVEYTIIIGEADGEKNVGSYVREIARYNLSAMPYDGPFYQIAVWPPPVDEHYYIYDGEERVYTDGYGDRFRCAPVETVAIALSREDETYRRIPPALALLDTFMLTEDRWDNLVVLILAH